MRHAGYALTQPNASGRRNPRTDGAIGGLCKSRLWESGENAAGRRVLTAPTKRRRRGRARCATITATTARRRHRMHRDLSPHGHCERGIVKMNASLSAAEVGCRGEGGGGVRDAAASLAAALGGTHRADRERGRNRHGTSPGHDVRSERRLVQIPCIERNALGRRRRSPPPRPRRGAAYTKAASIR